MKHEHKLQGDSRATFRQLFNVNLDLNKTVNRSQKVGGH